MCLVFLSITCFINFHLSFLLLRNTFQHWFYGSIRKQRRRQLIKSLESIKELDNRIQNNFSSNKRFRCCRRQAEQAISLINIYVQCSRLFKVELVIFQACWLQVPKSKWLFYNKWFHSFLNLKKLSLLKSNPFGIQYTPKTQSTASYILHLFVPFPFVLYSYEFCHFI